MLQNKQFLVKYEDDSLQWMKFEELIKKRPRLLASFLENQSKFQEVQENSQLTCLNIIINLQKNVLPGRLQKNTGIGMGFLTVSLLLFTLGVFLFLDRALLIMENLSFLIGLCLLIGMKSTLSFFFKKGKIKGSIFFFWIFHSRCIEGDVERFSKLQTRSQKNRCNNKKLLQCRFNGIKNSITIAYQNRYISTTQNCRIGLRINCKSWFMTYYTIIFLINKTQKKKNAIESQLNLVTEESLREIDYDKAIKDLAIKIRQSSSSSLKLARKSIAIKLVQSNSSSPQKLNFNVNSSVQDSRCRTELRTMSLYKPIDKTQTPFIQQHKFLITSIKTNRLKRNTSDDKKVVIPSNQITKSLQAFHFLDKTPFIIIKKPAQQPKYFLRYKKKTN